MDPNNAIARKVGRYSLYDVIARGGMAAIHLGTYKGSAGFSRTVAIKRLHESHAYDHDFVAMLLDEAHLAARISHPNVAGTIDVVLEGGEVFLVMEYVAGESLSTLANALAKQKQLIPIPILASVLIGALSGLQSAHDVRDENGVALNLVHRDMSPQNLLVGVDGGTRVIDFGVAKATSRMQNTQDGQIKGKLRYMAPEQLVGGDQTCLVDVCAVGVMLWELATGYRLRDGDNGAELAASILSPEPSPNIPTVAALRTGMSKVQLRLLGEIDEIVIRATAYEPTERYSSARLMAQDMANRLPVASASEVADWLRSVAGPSLDARGQLVSRVVRASAVEAGDLAPSDIMRALSASRPDASELDSGTMRTVSASAPGSLSDISVSLGPVSGPQSNSSVTPHQSNITDPGLPPKGSLAKTSMVAAIALLVLLVVFLSWRTTQSSVAKALPNLPVHQGTDASTLEATLEGNPPPLAVPLNVQDRPPIAEPSSRVDAGRPVMGAPPRATGTPGRCSEYHFDKSGIKRYNSGCLR